MLRRARHVPYRRLGYGKNFSAMYWNRLGPAWIEKVLLAAPTLGEAVVATVWKLTFFPYHIFGHRYGWDDSGLQKYIAYPAMYFDGEGIIAVLREKPSALPYLVFDTI